LSAPATAATGTVVPGWEPVRDAFEANLASGREVGAAVAVYHHGVPVVELVGGSFDDSGAVPYSSDTLQLIFSTTKGLTAIAVALCVQRGLLDYRARVADYWPEFASSGKDAITVAQLLSHQAGLPAVDGPLTIDQVVDWDHMVRVLGEQAPLWEPGTGHGYHAVTFGWLAGELVRRVDPKGRSLGVFVAEEVAAPVGAEAWIGLPPEQDARVSPLVSEPPSTDPAIVAVMQQFMGPDTLAGRALFLNGAFSPGDPVWNSPDFHRAEIPAANGISTAASLARIYSACVDEVDGVRLLEPDTVRSASATVTPDGEPDRVLVFPTTFGMGFMTFGPFTPMLGAGSFGHPGAGGSLAFAHAEAGIGFGYVMNRMDSTLNGDVRALSLVQAVKTVLAT
jgi:CubicO group peptidase (beta-lactamase class C family)